VRAVLRCAVRHDERVLVMSAWGCGAFGNPPVDIAEAFRDVLSEPEFAGKLLACVFAIFNDHNSPDGGNVAPFAKVFKVNAITQLDDLAKHSTEFLQQNSVSTSESATSSTTAQQDSVSTSVSATSSTSTSSSSSSSISTSSASTPVQEVSSVVNVNKSELPAVPVHTDVDEDYERGDVAVQWKKEGTVDDDE